MLRKKIGRRKGRRTKGFFFRQGRGWFTKRDGKFFPLLDEAGQKIREERIEERLLKEAHARFLTHIQQEETPEDDAEVGAVVAAYLDHMRSQFNGDIPKSPTGIMKTYVDRGQTLFDFCYGRPGEFFCNGDKKKREAKGEAKHIHAGFGHKLCSELTPADIDAWLKAHTWTKGGWRTRVQAVKRAMNFGVERKMIPSNPIKGYKVPKSATRITYLTPEQEAAMIEAASDTFAIALKVCIRTGARFGCEFAALTSKHVRDHGDRMEWVFKESESKTKRQRIIRVMDPEIMALVRKGMKNKTVFCNEDGGKWEQKILSHNFRRVKARIKKKGILLDEDACMYSCRHTYAKRTLEGYWTGKQTSINTLARLMGNSVKVCIDHYLQFSNADSGLVGSENDRDTSSSCPAS